MANQLAGLVVTLGLNAAEFISGFTKAEHQARTAVANISRTINQLKGIAAGIGIGLSANAFKDLIQGAFDAQEELSNLGKRAGITGSELSSLTTAAKLTHTGLEDVAGMSAKLSKALLDFGKESSKSTIVLKALGLSAKDVPELLEKPAEAVLKFAKLIDSLPEGGTKAAAQLLILGKAGGTTSAFLGELAKQTALVKTRTDEEIEAAKAFNDRLTEMGIKSADLTTRFANALLPTLDAVLTAFTKLTSEAGGVGGALEKLKNDGDIQEWARNGALALGTLVESLIAVGRVGLAVGSSFRVVAADVAVSLAESNAPSKKPFGSFGFTAEEAAKGEADYVAAVKHRDRIVAQADQNYADLIEKNGVFITDAIKKSFEMQDRATQAGIDAVANSDRNDRLNASNNVKASEAAAKAAAAKVKAVQAALNAANTATGDDPSRRILEGQIKALEASIARERDILNARESFLRDYYQDGRLSLEQFYDQLQAARDENLRNTLATISKEIALAEAAARKAVKASDKEGHKNTADAARERQVTLTAQARFAEEALSRDRDRATEQYGFQLNELNAKMLELAGNTAKAAAIRFDDQQAVFNRSLDAAAKAGDPIALRARAQNAAIKEALVTQNALNDKNRQFQLILNDVGIAQERLNIAQQSGAIGEIQFLVKSSEVARSQITRLTAIADAMAKVAAQAKDLNEDGSLNIVKLEQLQQVEQLRLGIERLASQTDLLKDKFNNLFASSFADALSDLATGVKSFKDAVADMAKSITKSIADIAAKDVAQQLFGKEGPLSGIGGIFAKLFGGKGADAAGGAAGATALATAGTTLTASGTLMTSAGTLHTTAATLHVTAATALSGAAGALTAAAAAMGISSGAGAAGALFKAASAFQGPAFGTAANGTSFAAGGRMLVGERGPEELIVPRGAQVTPNHLLGKPGNVYHINTSVNVMPGATTASVRQAKAQLRDAVMQAVKER